MKDLIPELYLEVFEFYLLQFLVSLFFNSSPTTDEEMWKVNSAPWLRSEASRVATALSLTSLLYLS